MSETTLAFGIVGTIFWFLFILFGILTFEIHLSFNKYKSALTVVQRYGVVLSLEQANEIYFGNQLRNEDVLEIFGSAGHDKVAMNGERLSKENSPWADSKLDAWGNIKNYRDAEGVFAGWSPDN
jgi:hypothetical protein